MGSNLETQYVPQFNFKFDQRYAKSNRIEDLLNKVKLKKKLKVKKEFFSLIYFLKLFPRLRC